MLSSKREWLRLVSAEKRVNINSRRFSALCGFPPDVLPEIWAKLRTAFAVEKLKPVHLLWMLYWFKVYPSDDVSSVEWGVSPDTFRKHRNRALWVCHETLDEVHDRFCF